MFEYLYSDNLVLTIPDFRSRFSILGQALAVNEVRAAPGYYFRVLLSIIPPDF